jgi:hypothetical protein
MSAIRKTLHRTATATEDVTQALSLGLLDVLSGVATGANTIVTSVGDIFAALGQTVKVVSYEVASGVGNVTKQVATSLGKIVKPIPVAGAPTAYLVQGAAKGVYFVVMSVADVVGSVSTIIGQTAQTTGKVIVFTLTSGKDVASSVVKKTNKTVKRVLGRTHKLVNHSSTKRHRARKH